MPLFKKNNRSKLKLQIRIVHWVCSSSADHYDLSVLCQAQAFQTLLGSWGGGGVLPEGGCGLRQAGCVALQVVYHSEESFDVLFVLCGRHFLDALQFGGILAGFFLPFLKALLFNDY